jgi:hypothetical protein
MSATITLPADLEQALAGPAAAQGMNVEQFAVDALRRMASLPEENRRPVVLNIGGNPGIVVQDAESYQKMLEEIEETKTLRAIAELKAGKGRPAKEFYEELGKELGIS